MLPHEFCDAIDHLQSAFEVPIWILVQGDSDKPYKLIDDDVVRAIRASRANLTKGL